MNEPNLNQVVDLGCRVGDTTTQRPRDTDASGKVTENGVYWSPSYDYSNIVKWNRYFASDYHAWNFPQQASPAAPLPQVNVGFSGLILKINQRCYLHTDPNECGANDYTNTELSAAAQTNPGSWWIMGEEPNKTSGPQTMTPSEYATWYHDKTQAILGGDRSAKAEAHYIQSLSAVSSNDLWAVGASGTPITTGVAWHWDGVKWSQIYQGGNVRFAAFKSVAALATNDVRKRVR